MAKERFNVEDSKLFSAQTEPEKKKVGRPRNERLVRDNSLQEGLPPEYTRATFIIEKELLDTLKDYAYTERMSIKRVMNEVIRDFVENKVDKKKLLHKPDDWR